MATSANQGYLPQIVSVTPQTGCTLTNASITGLTPENFKALAGTETNLAQVIAQSAEAKILGVKESNLSILLKSSIKNLKGALNKVSYSEQSVILPYIQRRQRRRLNANYWRIVAGTDCAAAGTVVDGVSIPSDAVDLTFDLGDSPWQSNSRYGGHKDGGPNEVNRYFLPGMTLIAHSWDTNAGAASQTAITQHYQIVRAEDAQGSGVQKAKVTVFPLGKTAPAVKLLKYGVAVLAANNISDYEAWCENQPVDNNLGLLINWFQTTRESRTTSQIYRETLQKILDGKINPWDQTFNFLSIAESNKRAAQMSERAWLNSVFFNDYLSSAQTPETYTSLPTVSDPEDPTCTLEYKANALGIYTMLKESGRVKDMDNGNINFIQLFEDMYELKRHREADGDSIGVIDVMTDRETANYLFELFTKYFKDRYGWSTDRFAKLNQKLTYNNLVNFEYDLYDVPDASCQLAVFRDQFFDDQIFAYNYASSTAGPGATGSDATSNLGSPDSSVTGPSFKNRARVLWFLDWSDVQVGVGGTSSVTRKSPDPETDRLYKCRISSNQTEYNLRSTKWTVFCDRPDRHLLIENFSLGELTKGTDIGFEGVTDKVGYHPATGSVTP